MPDHQQIQQSKRPEFSSQKRLAPTNQSYVSHPASIIQRARINPKSLTAADVLQLQRTIGNRAVGMLLSEIKNPSKVLQVPIQRQEIPEEEEPLQGKMIGTVQRQEIPEEETLQKMSENNTGMPDNLKAGVESLSGIDMSDVRVHYNSDKPVQIGALAYTQGTNIHVAPGQERHLPHEAWHVVQQKQGRVRQTMQAKGIVINDDEELEREADVIGGKAAQIGSTTLKEKETVDLSTVEEETSSRIIYFSELVQCKVGFEFELGHLGSALVTPKSRKEKKKYEKEVSRIGRGKSPFVFWSSGFTTDKKAQYRDYLGNGNLIRRNGEPGLDNDCTFHSLSKKEKLVHGNHFTLEADEGNINDKGYAVSNCEFVTVPFSEDNNGRDDLIRVLDEIVTICAKVKRLAENGRYYLHARELHSGGLVGKVVLPTNNLDGALQVTGGVDLARVSALMKSMSMAKGEEKDVSNRKRVGRYMLGQAISGSENSHPVGNAAAKSELTITAFKKVNPNLLDFGSKKLEGLIALMSAYIMMANKDNLGYAKTIAPLMARTDFAQMFRMLDDGERKYIVDHPKLLESFVETVSELPMNENLFPHGIYNDPSARRDDHRHALDGLTRAKWINGIITGIDYLTAAHFNKNPDLHLLQPADKKDDLESMGALGNQTEQVGLHATEAPIFEIRSLGSMTFKDMQVRALDIFDFIVSLNKDENAEYQNHNVV